MHESARLLIAELRLGPHPEGGFYRRTSRSAHGVRPDDGRPERPALSSIYFLLARGQHSRWHRVLSDEAWSFLERDPVTICCYAEESGRLTKSVLGRYVAGAEQLRVVPAGVWRAAEPEGEYTLASCCVGPGFEDADNAFAANHPAIAAAIRGHGAGFARLL
jgi:predicted cupin superfamily sugar epimerase